MASGYAAQAGPGATASEATKGIKPSWEERNPNRTKCRQEGCGGIWEFDQMADDMCKHCQHPLLYESLPKKLRAMRDERENGGGQAEASAEPPTAAEAGDAAIMVSAVEAINVAKRTRKNRVARTLILHFA